MEIRWGQTGEPGNWIQVSCLKSTFIKSILTLDIRFPVAFGPRHSVKHFKITGCVAFSFLTCCCCYCCSLTHSWVIWEEDSQLRKCLLWIGLDESPGPGGGGIFLINVWCRRFQLTRRVTPRACSPVLRKKQTEQAVRSNGLYRPLPRSLCISSSLQGSALSSCPGFSSQRTVNRKIR